MSYLRRFKNSKSRHGPRIQLDELNFKQVSMSFWHFFIFVKLRFYFFILFWLSYALSAETEAIEAFQKLSRLRTKKLWKFVSISLCVSPCYKSQTIEEKMWKNSKKESELKYFQNVKSSVIVCRFYINLFTVSNVNFQTVVNEKKIGKIILILL